jgi:uncharacterized protein YndB with AHSA1/START domain
MEFNRNAPATAEGELQIDADPQTVFSVISAIDQWPSWNPDVKAVTLQGPVRPGTVFRWKSGPSTLTSTLQVIDPPHEIAWTGMTSGPADHASRPRRSRRLAPRDDEAGELPIRLHDRVELAGGPYRGTDTRPPQGAQAPVALR